MNYFCILIKTPLKFAPKGPIDTNPTLFKIMAWGRIGGKPFTEQMLTRFTDAYMHIHVHVPSNTCVCMYTCPYTYIHIYAAHIYEHVMNINGNGALMHQHVLNRVIRSLCERKSKFIWVSFLNEPVSIDSVNNATPDMRATITSVFNRDSSLENCHAYVASTYSGVVCMDISMFTKNYQRHQSPVSI